MTVAHLSLYLCLWHESRYRVYYYYVEGAASYEHLTYLKSLFTCIRLRNKKFIYIYSEL